MQINYHLVGLGYIGKIHLMAMNNFHMVGMPIAIPIVRKQLITRHPEKLEDTLGFQEAVTPEAMAYPGEGLQLLDICNPNVYHHKMLLEAMDKGMHIYCEKPLTMGREETEDVYKAYKDKSSMVQLCYTMRYLPAFAKMRSAIEKGLIGEVTSFRIEYYHSSYLNEEKPYAWRLDKKMSGGGALYDLGSHAFDILQFLVEPVEQVMAQSRTIVKERVDPQGNLHPVTVDDWSLVQVLTQNKIPGTVEVSRIAAGDDGIRVRIYGTKGSLMVDVCHNPLDVQYYNKRGEAARLGPKWYQEDPYYNHVATVYPTPKLSQGFFMDSHMASLASFIGQIEQQKPVDGAPSLEACRNIEGILTACQESAEKASWREVERIS